jgi:hypothetical protein
MVVEIFTDIPVQIGKNYRGLLKTSAPMAMTLLFSIGTENQEVSIGRRGTGIKLKAKTTSPLPPKILMPVLKGIWS